MDIKKEIIPPEGYSNINLNPKTGKYTVKYDGKLIETIVTDNSYVADQWVTEIRNKYTGFSVVLVGLDVIWRPGSNKSATLQLCINDKCLILIHQFYHMITFSTSLTEFFTNSTFVCVGTEVDKIIEMLRNEYRFMFNKSLDIREAAKMKWTGGFDDVPDLEDLAKEVACVCLKRHKHVLESNCGGKNVVS